MCCGKNDCVCDTVREIVRVQDEVAEANTNCCLKGCDQSIKNFLSPMMTSGNGSTTIPFALYCKGDCDPFIGSGVFRSPVGGSGMTALRCVASPIFRARKFVYKDRDKCCVQLELLLPITMGGSTPGPSGEGKRICDFFPGSSIRNLQETGICLTIDLSCFCGIVCLDPVTPRPVSEFNITDDEE